MESSPFRNIQEQGRSVSKETRKTEQAEAHPTLTGNFGIGWVAKLQGENILITGHHGFQKFRVAALHNLTVLPCGENDAIGAVNSGGELIKEVISFHRKAKSLKNGIFRNYSGGFRFEHSGFAKMLQVAGEFNRPVRGNHIRFRILEIEAKKGVRQKGRGEKKEKETLVRLQAKKFSFLRLLTANYCRPFKNPAEPRI